MPRRGILVFVPLMLAAQGVSAQPRATNTNDVAACSLIVDPTAQRLCIESTLQSRPASTFDPTAQKLRMERRPPPGRDALAPASKPAATGNAGVKPGVTPPPAKPEGFRESKWRLQIP